MNPGYIQEFGGYCRSSESEKRNAQGNADDFERFQEESKHKSVLRELSNGGSYYVNYRASKYGCLVNYRTRYTPDKKTT